MGEKRKQTNKHNNGKRRQCILPLPSLPPMTYRRVEMTVISSKVQFLKIQKRKEISYFEIHTFILYIKEFLWKVTKVLDTIRLSHTSYPSSSRFMSKK